MALHFTSSEKQSSRSYKVFTSLTSLLSPHSTLATLAVLLFLEHAGHTNASESLHYLFPLPGTFFPQMTVANSPPSFKSLLKCHLLNEAYLDHPISNCNLSLLYPALSVSLPPTPSNILYYLLTYYA